MLFRQYKLPLLGLCKCPKYMKNIFPFTNQSVDNVIITSSWKQCRSISRQEPPRYVNLLHLVIKAINFNEPICSAVSCSSLLSFTVNVLEFDSLQINWVLLVLMWTKWRMLSHFWVDLDNGKGYRSKLFNKCKSSE